ncbi:MAG: DUF2877 domain-containing protein [Oligoflexia bacterium]|nr:DUF2877 domain-containing protein [Oligoflexia bacterium]
MNPGTFEMGDCVSEGEYTLHSRFTRAVNFRRTTPSGGEEVVSVVDPSVGPGPGAIVLSSLERPPGRSLADRLRVDGGSFILGDERFDAARGTRFRSDLGNVLEGWRQASAEALDQGLARFREQVLSEAPRRSLVFLLEPSVTPPASAGFEAVLVERFREAAAALAAGEIGLAMSRLQGLGWGLTPSGDDFIAGLLLARHVLEVGVAGGSRSPWFRALRGAEAGLDFGRMTPLSRAFIGHASSGRANAKWLRLLAELPRGPSEELDAAIRAVLDVGASSGADMATGFLFTMEKGRSR